MTPLSLPAELTIRTAAETRAALLAALGGGDAAPWVADAARVAEVDTAGVQLLLALARSAREAGKALQLAAPSQPLLDACRGLGVTLPFTNTPHGSPA